PQTRSPIPAESKKWSGPSFAGDVEDIAPGARWRGRLIGPQGAPFNLAALAAAPIETVKLPATSLALGFGALGTMESDSRSRLGELLAAGGCAVQLPANGENQADFAVTQDALAPEAQLAHGLAADGAFAKLARFEVAGEVASTPLSDLITGLLAAAHSPQIAFAAVVEAAALVGACLRRGPGSAGAENIFAFPAVRDWLTFTAEPAYANTVAFIVGVAALPGSSALANFTRPCGSNDAPLLHAHAAALPFRPVRHGRLALPETAANLFDGPRVLGVLHLLPDLRPEIGAGQSRFYRGACWFGPLDL
ncbi:MAG TPA: hypothetical protein VHC95_05975, partial [Opitutales bacterium]|nr:hypothetical protein [Opitutales bacterium]